MEFERALRALPWRFGEHGQQCAALGASRNLVSARHLHRPGAKRVFSRGTLERGPLLLIAAAILISVLAIFPI